MKFGKKKDKEVEKKDKKDKKDKKKGKSSDDSSSAKNNNNAKKVFGGSLPIFGDEIPLVIRETTEYMERYGLTTSGIFRESGSLQQILLYKSQYEKGESPAFNPYEPHVVASLLKAYLRELKDPLLTFEHYDMFIACESINDEKVKLDVLKKVLKCLPEYNIKVIKFICQFLLKVVAQSEQNKMTPDTLSIVFLPTILRPKAVTDQEILQYTVEDQKSTKTLMSSILLNYDEIFEDPNLIQPKSRQTRSQTEFVSPSSSYSNKTPISSSNSPLSTSPSSSPFNDFNNNNNNNNNNISPYKSPLSTMSSDLPFDSTTPTVTTSIPINLTHSNNNGTNSNTLPPIPIQPLPPIPTQPLPPIPTQPLPVPKPNNTTNISNIANILPKPPSLVLPPKPIPKIPVETRQRSNTTFV